MKVRPEVGRFEEGRAAGEHASVSQHAPDLADGCHRIGNVLEDRVRNDVVERCAAKGKLMDVGSHVGPVPIPVDRDVTMTEVVADRLAVRAGSAPPVYVQLAAATRKDREVASIGASWEGSDVGAIRRS
jgi:hypothetical protein